MWLRAIMCYGILSVAQCGKLDDMMNELFATPDPQRQQSEFMKQLPRFMQIQTRLPNYVQLIMDYELNVVKPLAEVVESFEELSQQIATDNTSQLILTKGNAFIDKCKVVTQIADFLHDFKGWKCADSKFNPKIASTLFELIDQFKFSRYSLSFEDDAKFKMRYATLYFHTERNNMNVSNSELRTFIATKNGTTYKNKAELLNDVVKLFGIDMKVAHMSDCLPLTAFVMSHYNRSAVLEARDIMANQAYHFANISHICAMMSNHKNPYKGKALSESIMRKIEFVEPFLTEWFDTLLDSTWPQTETELIRGFMKESAQNRPITESSAEYERIANVVNSRMAVIGNPMFKRQYVMAKDFSKQKRSSKFESQCKPNSCTQAASMGALCTILRVSNNQSTIDENLERFERFSKSIKEIVKNALEKKYKREKSIAEVIKQLRGDGVNLKQFDKHSSVIGMKRSQNKRNCKVSFGIKTEDGLESSALQTIHYHDDGGASSKCYDWVFFLGL